MLRTNYPDLKEVRVMNKRGPKRVFSPEDLHAVECLSKLGATDKQVAEYFRVGKSTVEYWMKNYADFKQARKRGGLEADMKVAECLFKRAIGYEYIEEEFSAIEINGKPVPLEKMRKVKRTKKYLPPDVKAITKWLTCRQREAWAIVPEHILRHTGNINHAHRKAQDIPVNELTENTKEALFEVLTKQLTVKN